MPARVDSIAKRCVIIIIIITLSKQQNHLDKFFFFFFGVECNINTVLVESTAFLIR